MNDYSPVWYETFLDSIPAHATEKEVAFVARQLPVHTYPAILDLCCGPARHATALAALGYRIFGVDANADAIRRARRACPGADFEVGDMRRLDALGRSFDGVINLWHSFGYFDAETNIGVLRQLRGVLRPGGRVILDVYNRDHFARLPETEISERGGHRIRTERRWVGSRHHVALEYDGAPGDRFEWQLYSPPELADLCRSVGLEPLLACAWFDEATAPSAEHARMQLVLEAIRR